MISPETIAKLRERYAAPPLPKCRLCGADMGLHEIGDGRAVWYCDGPAGKWLGVEPGPQKKAAERHFDESRYVRIRFGDEDVIELLDAYLEMTKCPTRAAIYVLGEAARKMPEGWSIELEFSRDEASMSLIDPETGSDVDEYFGDFECSFLGAIEIAVELAAKGGDV